MSKYGIRAANMYSAPTGEEQFDGSMILIGDDAEWVYARYSRKAAEEVMRELLSRSTAPETWSDGMEPMSFGGGRVP